MSGLSLDVCLAICRMEALTNPFYHPMQMLQFFINILSMEQLGNFGFRYLEAKTWLADSSIFDEYCGIAQEAFFLGFPHFSEGQLQGPFFQFFLLRVIFTR